MEVPLLQCHLKTQRQQSSLFRALNPPPSPPSQRFPLFHPSRRKQYQRFPLIPSLLQPHQRRQHLRRDLRRKHPGRVQCLLMPRELVLKSCFRLLHQHRLHQLRRCQYHFQAHQHHIFLQPLVRNHSYPPPHLRLRSETLSQAGLLDITRLPPFLRQWQLQHRLA